MNNTTRRHPRSCQEAFPRTAEYGAAIEVPSRNSPRLIEKLANVGLAVGLGLAFALIMVVELSK